MASRVPQLTQRVKERKVYSDFLPNLQLLPVTGELQLAYNAQAVALAIQNLIFTYPTERYYQPLLGSTITRNIFDFIDDFTLDKIRDSILQTINTYERRAVNPQVTVTPATEQNYVNVTVSFGIALLPGQPYTTPVIVLKVRG